MKFGGTALLSKFHTAADSVPPQRVRFDENWQQAKCAAAAT
jgi:hypothetical protein